MRRRPAPPPSAQQMIREYLGRVSVAATRVLPKGDRLLFVGRTRAAIEAQVGPLASADADAVLNALNSMGDPEDLAKRERERLYSARRRGAAAAPPALWKPSKESRRGSAPPPARQPGPARARRPRPWPHRALTGPVEPQPAEPQPAEPAPERPQPEPVPVVPRQADPPEALLPPAGTSLEAASPDGVPAGEVPAGEVPRAGEMPAAGETVLDTPVVDTPVVGLPVPDLEVLEPVVAVPDTAVPDTAAPGGSGPDGSDAGVAGPDTAGPGGREPGGVDGSGPGGREPGGVDPDAPQPGGSEPGWMRPVRRAPAPEETGPASIVPGMSPSSEPDEAVAAKRRSPAGWRSPISAALAEAWALARKHPLEAVAVVLLGLGGLILPFPFWLIGGIVALRSRRWDARDKWIALAGPPLVTFAVLVIRAATSPGNFFSAFYQAAHHDVGLSIRAGCVLCAAYLIWRLRRGPRLRTLPPWQRPR